MMELSELDDFLSKYTENEQEAKQTYFHVMETGKTDTLEEITSIYQSYPVNITQNRGSDIRVWRHERYCNPSYHSHAFLEIMYQYRGQCIHNIAGETMLLAEGEFCFVSPGVIHKPEIFDDSLLMNILVEIPMLQKFYEVLDGTDSALTQYLREILYRKRYPKYLYIKPHTQDKTLNQLMRELILEYYNNEIYCDQMLYTRCLTLLLHLMRCHRSDMEPAKELIAKSGNILEILQYIHDSYRTVTLTEIAQKFNYNEQYISRLIHMQTGRTFYQHLSDLRINHAKVLLLTTNLSFAEIAWHCGYKGDAYFHRAFRQAVGMTPQAFRMTGSIVI
ncbi:MAG: helix-turn-helix domain-containing protein [Clostridia bacterium]|nr:helix-turn-helix domain-containing protein [Clostridia bacterium]